MLYLLNIYTKVIFKKFRVDVMRVVRAMSYNRKYIVFSFAASERQ